MGRKIKFNLSGVSLQSEIVKVDRSKIYGSVKKVVRDNNNEDCVLSDLYQGSLILPRGSISQVLIDIKGNSVSRSELVGFNLNNQKVEKVPSIFSVDNLCDKVSIDEFLSVNVKSIYQLKIDEEEVENWKSSFNNDEIYHFVFNYREDFEGDDAYIISNGENFFCVVGKKNEYEFLKLNNIQIEDDENEEIDDELDFSMF